jgi:sugar/nucleoside kinase (ribokinase family)
MITVIGSINLDLTAEVGRLPSPGETVLGGDFRTAPGGKGANQALAARRAGSEGAHGGRRRQGRLCQGGAGAAEIRRR